MALQTRDIYILGKDVRHQENTATPPYSLPSRRGSPGTRGCVSQPTTFLERMSMSRFAAETMTLA